MVAPLASTGLLLALLSAPQEPSPRFTVRVDPRGIERRDAPLELRLEADREISAKSFERIAAGARADLHPVGEPQSTVLAQVDIDADGKGLVVSWIAPQLGPTDGIDYELTLRAPDDAAEDDDDATGGAFRFAPGQGHRDLLRGDRLIWREVTPQYDPDDHERTKKPFLHLYDASGTDLLTKGPGGLHSHHRGVFAGWNRTKSPDGTYDFWHCPGTVRVLHREHLPTREATGPVRARSASRIDWVSDKDKVIVHEHREVTAWQQSPGRLLLDVEVTLRSAGGRIVLDGDPHHGGVQFRAAQAIADHPDRLSYLRPATAAGGKNDIWTDCSWAAGRFAIGDGSQVVVHMDHPDNPRPTRYSTRDYGRFGAFCRSTLEPGKSLVLRYRLLLLDADAHPAWDRESFDAEQAAFATPARVTASPR